jgi:hypothetical protein
VRQRPHSRFRSFKRQFPRVFAAGRFAQQADKLSPLALDCDDGQVGAAHHLAQAEANLGQSRGLARDWQLNKLADQ